MALCWGKLRSSVTHLLWPTKHVICIFSVSTPVLITQLCILLYSDRHSDHHKESYKPYCTQSVPQVKSLDRSATGIRGLDRYVLAFLINLLLLFASWLVKAHRHDIHYCGSTLCHNVLACNYRSFGPKMGALEAMRFDNLALRALPVEQGEQGSRVRTVRSACYSRVQPTPLEAPRLVAASAAALSLLDLAPSEVGCHPWPRQPVPLHAVLRIGHACGSTCWLILQNTA